jgi:hypothetical protein
MAGRNQLRGWKEIAGFLETSVSSAVRWEVQRSLPVHRLPGEGKEAVFAFRDEIELWQRSDSGRAGDGDASAASPLESVSQRRADSGAPGPIPGSIEEETPARVDRRRFLVGGITFAVAALAICAVWFMGWPGRALPQPAAVAERPTTRAPASREPAPVILSYIQLDVARPDGWKGTIQVADGGAAQIGPSPNHPTVILRPRLTGTSLMLEIARADGKPVKDGGPASQPFVLVLDPNVTVQVRQPFAFSVRWTSGQPPAMK